MAWRLVEEIFAPTNLEEVKQKLGAVIGNALAIHRDVKTMDDSQVCRKEEEEPRM